MPRSAGSEADGCGGEACGWLVRAPAGGCGRSPKGLIGLAMILYESWIWVFIQLLQYLGKCRGIFGGMDGR